MDNSPSSIIEPAAYAILDKEFGGNKHIEKVNIREKINLKHESVSLDDRKENEQNGSDDGADFKNEVIIKSGVINVKDEVARMATPKILGKIDLSDNHKKKNTAEPATEKNLSPGRRLHRDPREETGSAQTGCRAGRQRSGCPCYAGSGRSGCRLRPPCSTGRCAQALRNRRGNNGR